jgi:hypothetical protein
MHTGYSHISVVDRCRLIPAPAALAPSALQRCTPSQPAGRKDRAAGAHATGSAARDQHQQPMQRQAESHPQPPTEQPAPYQQPAGGASAPPQAGSLSSAGGDEEGQGPAGPAADEDAPPPPGGAGCESSNAAAGPDDARDEREGAPQHRAGGRAQQWERACKTRKAQLYGTTPDSEESSSSGFESDDGEAL